MTTLYWSKALKKSVIIIILIIMIIIITNNNNNRLTVLMDRLGWIKHVRNLFRNLKKEDLQINVDFQLWIV